MVDVGKVVVSYVKQHWPEISAMAKRVFGDVKEAVQDVVKVVSFIWEHFGDQIVSQTKIAWEFIKKYLGGVFQTIQGMVEIITGLLHGNFGKMWEGIKDMFSGQTKVIQAVFEAGLKTLVNLAATLGEAARQALLKPIATLAGAVAGHIADVGRAITDKFSAAAGWGEGLATHIKDGVTGGLKGIGAGAWDVVNNVGEFISGKAGTIRDWGEGIGTKIKNAVPAAIVGIGNEAWDKINNVGEFIAGKAGAVKEWGANIGNWIKNAAPAALVGIGNAAWDKINNIGSAITDKAEAVKGWGDHLANLIEAGLRGGLHIGAAIADGVDRAWGAVKEAFGDLKDKIVHWLRSAFDWFSPSGLFEELGQDMMHGLAKGIVGKAAHPLEALKWMFKIVGKAFPGNWQDWLQNVAGAGVGLVRSAVGTNAPSEIIGGATGNALAMAEWMDSVLNHYPYTWGGGHAQIGQPSRSTGLSPHGHWYPGVGFDCSGFVSGALHAGGMLNSVLVSGDFGSWGANGPDPRGVSVAYNPDHTYLNLRGRNYGTGWGVNGGPGTDGTGFDMSGRYGWSHWPGGLRGTSSYAGPDTLEPLSNPGDFAARETFLGLGSAAAGIMPTAGPNNLVGALGGGNVGGFWKGTAFAPGGWAMVGEKGPELMYVPRGSQIIPNGRVPGGSTANSPGGGDMTIHVPISLDGQLVADVVQKQLLRKQARNGTTGLV